MIQSLFQNPAGFGTGFGKSGQDISIIKDTGYKIWV
jgi:hypothetical protein